MECCCEKGYKNGQTKLRWVLLEGVPEIRWKDEKIPFANRLQDRRRKKRVVVIIALLWEKTPFPSIGHTLSLVVMEKVQSLCWLTIIKVPHPLVVIVLSYVIWRNTDINTIIVVLQWSQCFLCAKMRLLWGYGRTRIYYG